MAGGLGSRLMPLTSSTPKPMLQIGSKPILQIIIEHLRSYGLHRIYVATNHLSEVIKGHFRDGRDFGVEIEYLEEDKRMGTAGALTLLPDMPAEPFIVANGDVLSRLNFAALLESQATHHAAMTICVKEYRLSVPFGVVRETGGRVSGIDEKPEIPVFINAGMYCVDPSVLPLIPKDTAFDMTQVAELCIAQGRPVHSFPVIEYWRDIGQIDDFRTARDEFGHQ
jgi:NDP-sugar pyrophosphorylase family protein